MKLSFLRVFEFLKKGKPAPAALAPLPPPPPPLEKPASERFGKTVMPNVSRVVGLEPARDPACATPLSLSALSAPGAPRRISLGVDVPRPALTTRDAERTIALALVDLVAQIPGALLQTAEIDPNHHVLLKAAEIERGMANGRPTVLLRSIYQQAPEFFTSEVSETDAREIVLPFSKVLEQFAGFQVRPDQVQDEAVPQVETPFLKVTLEDSERFGTPLRPLHTTELPPVAVQPATAGTIAAAEPEAAPKTPPLAPIRLSLPKGANAAGGGAAKISPNGTGGPATERVPASSGPPVPIPLPVPLAPAAPVRIPFKITPPANDLRASSLPKKPAAYTETKPVEFASAGPRIRLPLSAVLRGIPSFQLCGPIDDVPDTAQIELPFSIVEPQLSLGRIAISPAQFVAALPEEHRHLFKIAEAEVPVALPLQEVLQNLPNETLQLREDQEEAEIAQIFETPFSQKAAEDAARMKGPAGPIGKGASHPGAVAVEEKDKEVEVEVEVEKAKPAERTALQSALDTDDDPLDARSVVAHASRLPGVSACAIVFSDGLSLAGNIPAEYEADALCAMAPAIVKRIDAEMIGANLGPLNGVTLFCAKAPVSFFAHGNICLAALHSASEIAAEVRARLGRTAQELARMYSQPA